MSAARWRQEGPEKLEIDRTLQGIVVDETSLRFTIHPSIEVWGQTLGTLCNLLHSVHWWIGDCLLQGEAWYGEACYQYLPEGVGFGPETLRNDKWVASRWPPEKRKAELSFSHHMLLAGLPEADRFEWAELAAHAGMTRQELKEAMVIAKTPMTFTMEVTRTAEDIHATIVEGSTTIPPGGDFSLIVRPNGTETPKRLDLETIKGRLDSDPSRSYSESDLRVLVRVLVIEVERLRSVMATADEYLVGLRQARYGMEPPGETALTRLSCAYTVACKGVGDD